MSEASPDPVLAAVDLRRGADASALLSRVLDRCRAEGTAAVVVFDLDSTLLDNKARQAKIMSEYGERNAVPSLANNQAEHWQGWDYRIAMRNSGLPSDEVEAHVEPYRDLWRDLFFTSEYCRLDEAVAGAVTFVSAVQATGAKVCYVTGRHEGMRAGTVDNFGRLGLPVPDGDRVQLWMKPTLEEHDDDYKARVHADLPREGTVVAVFDNEPIHVNDYRKSFGEALVIHMATDHSMREILVDPQIPSVADFADFRPSGA